jgi:hypothetical protein
MIKMEVTEEERAIMWDAISAGTDAETPEEAEGEQPASPKGVDEDPWASVPLAVKESFNNMAAKVESFDTIALRLKQAESRIGALQNKIAQEPPPEPTAEEKKWQELKSDDPYLVEAMEYRFTETNNSMKQQYEAAEAKVKNLEDELILRIEKTALSQKHPDWENMVNTDAYKDWLATQAIDIKQKTESILAKDAVVVLDKFVKDKQHKDPASIAEERKQRLNAAVMVNGTTPKTVKSVDDMSIEEYREYVAKELWPNPKR